MKNAINYKEYKEYLLKHAIDVIDKFSKSTDNKDVYALVLDAQSCYGTVLIKWNTYKGLNETLKQDCYQGKTKEQIYASNGLKYSIGDFYYEDPANCSELAELELKYYNFMIEDVVDEVYEHNCNQYINTLIEVLLDLKPHFEQLNRTEEFIFYVVDHDEDDNKYIRKTVDEESFYKAFPDLIGENVY